jgi:hypothetical protein
MPIRRTDQATRAAAADFDHPRRQDDCEVLVNPTGPHTRWWTAQCVIHDCRTEVTYVSAAEADEGFRCDLGRRWRFVIHHRDDWPTGPVMTDLSDLYRHVRNYVCREVDGDRSDRLVLWRYLLDGSCQPLEHSYTLTRQGRRCDVWVRAAELPSGQPPAQYEHDGVTYLWDTFDRPAGHGQPESPPPTHRR